MVNSLFATPRITWITPFWPLDPLPYLPFLDELKLLEDEADEDHVWVQEAVVDTQLDELCEEVQDLPLQLQARGHSVLLQGLDHQGLKQPDVGADHSLNNNNNSINQQVVQQEYSWLCDPITASTTTTTTTTVQLLHLIPLLCSFEWYFGGWIDLMSVSCWFTWYGACATLKTQGNYSNLLVQCCW